MRIQCSGEIVMDEDKWLYDWCEIPSFSPGDLRNAIEKLADGEELVVEINSPGGVCYSGFEIYSVLRGCGHPTVGEVQGMAASAASTILMGCETRRVSPVGQVMIHDPLICARGNAAALRETAKYLDSVKESILNAYELRCREKCGRVKIAQLMSEETWMTAQDAVALGFADEIILAEGEGAEGTLPTTAAANSVTNGLNLHNVDVLLQQYEDAVRSGEREAAAGHPVAAAPHKDPAGESGESCVPEQESSNPTERGSDNHSDWQMEARLNLEKHKWR